MSLTSGGRWQWPPLVLHGLLPYIHKSYMKSLAEARAMAASCGLRVLDGFSLVDPPHAQALYEQFLSRRATRALP